MSDSGASSSAGGDDADRRRRRRRGLLRMYYGASKEEEDKKKKQNPLDLDGESFDGDAYLAKMYRTHHLQSIIDKESKLGREIKALDSDMQTLVYENYNKFISATDTIRKMKTQVDSMEAEMQKLAENMEQTSKLSEDITTTLRPRRTEISRLASGHVMLKKFQFLFELPARLRQCVDMGAVAQAVGYYGKASRVLEAYRDLESFRGIYTSCREIMRALHNDLQAKVEDPNTSLAEIRETLPLLAQIGFDSEDALSARLLQQAKRQWDTDRTAQEENYSRDLEAFAALQAEEAERETADTAKATVGDDGDDDDDDGGGGDGGGEHNKERDEGQQQDQEEHSPQQHNEVGDGNEDEEEDAVTAAAGVTEGAVAQRGGGGDNVDDTTKSGDDEGSRREVQPTHEEEEEEEEEEEAKQLLQAPSKKNKKTCDDGGEGQKDNRKKKKKKKKKTAATLAHKPLAAFLTFTRKRLFYGLVEWIMCYQDIFLPQGKQDNEDREKQEQELFSFVQNLITTDFLPSLKSKLSAVLEWPKLTAADITNALQQTHQRISTLAGVLTGGDLTADGLQVVVDVADTYTQRCIAGVHTTLGCIMASALEKATDLNAFDKAVEDACAAVDEAMLAAKDDLSTLAAGSFAPEHDFFSSTFVNKHVRQELLLQSAIHLSSTIEHEATTNWRALLSYRIAFEWTENRLSTSTRNILRAFPAQSTHKDDLLKEEVLSVGRRACKWLLNKFTQLSGTAMSKEMILSVRETAPLSTPQDDDKPSPRIAGVVKELGELAGKLSGVMPAPKSSPLSSLSPFGSRIQRDAVTNVHRLFLEAIQVFQEPKNTLDSVLSCVLLIILKAFSEAIRECTLTPAAAHQLQVDAVYLHTHLTAFVYDEDVEGSVCALLAQAVNAVLRRTPEPPALLPVLDTA